MLGELWALFAVREKNRNLEKTVLIPRTLQHNAKSILKRLRFLPVTRACVISDTVGRISEAPPLSSPQLRVSVHPAQPQQAFPLPFGAGPAAILACLYLRLLLRKRRWGTMQKKRGKRHQVWSDKAQPSWASGEEQTKEETGQGQILLLFPDFQGRGEIKQHHSFRRSCQEDTTVVRWCSMGNRKAGNVIAKRNMVILVM